MLGRFPWTLVVSVCAHSVLAAAFAATRSGARVVEQPTPPERDVWIGATLETTSQPGNASSGPMPSPPLTSQSAPDTAAPPPPKAAPARAEAKPKRVERAAREDPLDALAARILAYSPTTSSARRGPTGKDSDELHEEARGGMEGRAENTAARGFAKAFTRALPAANSADPIWNALPLGHVGIVRIAVTIDEDGKLSESAVLEQPRKPPVHLARLVERTILLLQGGRFALTKAGKGTETLRVDVTLSERPMEAGPLALGFEPPGSRSPGRAYFQLSTGRFVEATVTIESSMAS